MAKKQENKNLSEIERGVILRFGKIMLAIMLCVMVAGVIAGCMSTPPAVGYTENSERFAIAVSEGRNDIYVDTYTGVMYFYHDGGDSGGMSVMLDQNGKPLIWGGYNGQ